MKSTPFAQLHATAIRIAGLLLLAVAGGVILALFADGGVTIAPPAASRDLSAEEQRYIDTIGVRVLAVNDEMQAIAALVSAKSRNVLELNRRGAHVETLAAEMEGFREQHAVPERFITLDAKVQAATADGLAAIAQARDALRRFDFSGIADLIPSFNQAAASMNEAATELRAAIGHATPVATGRTTVRSPTA